jgi:hypothetical protein
MHGVFLLHYFSSISVSIPQPDVILLFVYLQEDGYVYTFNDSLLCI